MFCKIHWIPGPPRLARPPRPGPCLKFGFQYALVRNNQSKKFWGRILGLAWLKFAVAPLIQGNKLYGSLQVNQYLLCSFGLSNYRQIDLISLCNLEQTKLNRIQVTLMFQNKKMCQEWYEKYYHYFLKYIFVKNWLIFQTQLLRIVTIMCRNDDLSWTMSCVGCLLID